VRDQSATEKPAAALSFAEKIADLWMDAYLPRELARLEAQRLAVASAQKIPFRKTAWVRPSVPRQEASSMKATSAAAVLTATAVAMGAQRVGVCSEPVQVNFSPHLNRCWSTVFTNEVPLRWDWNVSATRAELAVVGMNASFETNFTRGTSNYLWRVFSSEVPASEDVYALRLTFYDANAAIVGTLTSRLAVVTGAFGKTTVDPGPSDRKWTSVKNNAVVPYDATWTAATADATNSQLVIAKVGGATKTNTLADASGYFGWKIKHGDWGYGTFNLALTFPETEGGWDATLRHPLDGTMIKMQ
jgi:hypothetical protein